MRPLLHPFRQVTGFAVIPVLAAAVGIGLAPPAAARPAPRAANQLVTTGAVRAVRAQITHRWNRPDASLGRTPEALVGASATGTAPGAWVRVVSLRLHEGRPVVSVRLATGHAAAVAAVEAAQHAPGALSVGLDSRISADVTDDPYRSTQWALDRLGAEWAWASGAGTGAGVTVAVVDSGIDKTQPDLAGQVLPGKDFVVPTGDGTADGYGHGTHVAGIVAAIANNGVGVAGLAPGVKLLPVRTLDATGSGWSADAAAGIIWAADHGAQVVNLSLGGTVATAVMQQAVDYAIARGVVVVAAGGNARAAGNPVNYPAAYPGVIGVAATERRDASAAYSNTGAYVDIAAPGTDIMSTYPGATYQSMSGTSMATPYVAAAAALVKAANPALTADAVTSLLEQSATDLAPAGRDDATGYGLVNPLGAVCLVTGCSGRPPVAPATALATALSQTPGATSVRYGGTVRGSVRLVDASTGVGLRGQPLQLCRRVAPARSFTCAAATTDASGTTRYRWPARANVAVRATFRGTSSAAAATSSTTAYTVVAIATLTTTRRAVHATVSPHSRQRITLQRKHGSRWIVVAQRRVDARGRATFDRLPGARYRVRVASSTTLGGVTSGLVRVR